MRRVAEPRVEPVPEILVKVRNRRKAANIAATMAHHPGLSRSFAALYNTILREGATPRRQRELVMLRTGWNCQAEYEFGQHTLYGLEAGLTDAEVFALTRPLSTHEWSEQDHVLLQMADDLYA